MNNHNKSVKASEYYSRRVTNETEAVTDSPSLKTETSYNSGYTGRRPPNIKSSNINAVTANLKKAAEQGSSKDKDEVKMLSHRLMGTEAAALAELNTVRTVRRGNENLVKLTRYTVTRFSKGEREKRKERKEYHKNEKEIKRINRQINEWKKEEKKQRKEEKAETESVISEKYKKKQENARKERDALKNRNRTIRKRMVAERHTRSISVIRNRALSGAKETGKELIRTPNRYLLMIADDRDAEQIAIKSFADMARIAMKAMTGMVNMFLASVKSILIAISPLLFAGVLVMFMMYILFFSDFDIGITKDMISNEVSEDATSIISTYIINKRNEMAKEKVDSDNSIQVYFIKLNNETVAEMVTYMEGKSKEQGNPSFMLDEWMQSSEAEMVLETLVTAMCYWIPEEEIAAYPEENLEAYIGNIQPEPEPAQPGAGGGIGIGGEIGIGISSGLTKGEPESETEPVTEQTVKKAIIGYYSVSEIQ